MKEAISGKLMSGGRKLLASSFTFRHFGTEWGNINLNNLKKPKAIASSLLIFAEEGQLVPDIISYYSDDEDASKARHFRDNEHIVLFTNWKVIVYKDKKKQLWKKLCTYPGKENYEKRINEIFEKYFDPLYDTE